MKALLNRIFGYGPSTKKRFFQFALVGASGTLVDLGVVFVLNSLFREVITAPLSRNLIQFTAYEISVLTNFLLSFFWVWKDRQGPFWKTFLKYNLSTALAFAVRILVFNLCIIILGTDRSNRLFIYYSVYFFSIAVAMIINFLIIHNKVFEKNKAVQGRKNNAA